MPARRLGSTHGTGTYVMPLCDAVAVEEVTPETNLCTLPLVSKGASEPIVLL